jgi:hypothetical protein
MTAMLPTGLYQYTYPTFTDKPQWVYVHFLTPDQQLAFVTYPFHPYPKTAQFVPVSWFDTVCLAPLAGYSPLVDFLIFTLPGFMNPVVPVSQPVEARWGSWEGHNANRLLAA